MKRVIYKIIILAVFILMLLLILNYLKQRDKNNHEIIAYGNIEIRQVDMGFRVDGTIADMLFEEGDIVKKGQLLAYLENKQYSSVYQKSLAEIDLNTAARNNASSKYERHKPLCLENTTSKQTCDELYNNKKETQAALKAAIAESKRAKTNLDDTKIYAPCDGIIMTRVQEPGSIAIPGQPIYTIAKNKPVWIRAYIPETNLGNIKYGMKAKVYTDTTNPNTGKKREYTGWVGYISPVAEFTPKTVETTDLRTDLVYRIRVYVYEVDDFLRQGMPVTVTFDLKNSEVRKNLRGDYDELRRNK